MILRRSSRTDPRLVLGSALAFALPIGALVALNSGAAAQAGPRPADQAANPADALKQRDQELDAALARARDSADAQAKLRGEIDGVAPNICEENAPGGLWDGIGGRMGTFWTRAGGMLPSFLAEPE